MKIISLRMRHRLIISLIILLLGSCFAAYGRTVISASALDKTTNDSSATAIAASNELLVKISSKDVASLPANAQNKPSQAIGLSAFDNTLAKFPGVTAQPIFHNHSKKPALAAWYKITIPIVPGETQAQTAPDPSPTSRSGKSEPVKQSVPKFSLKNVGNSLKASGSVEFTEKNYLVKADLAPNDPYYLSTGSWGQTYADMWGMKRINAEAAWDVTTGSASTVVADIDTGVDRNHPDIASNMWVNPNEIPGNGIDDDNNGYVDDYNGWDWVNNDNNPIDDNGHGTHTAGTIAASGNNGQGVTGVSWNSKIMALKFLNNGGNGYMENAVKAIVYAADMGAKVTSNSYGCACSSKITDDALAYAHSKGVINVVAAGNSNADALGFSPANSDAAITVGSTDSSDLRSSFSNYGRRLDVAAPGEDILSLKASGGNICGSSQTVGSIYCRLSGTSMSTPHVAGLAALAVSAQPNMTNEQFRQLIRTQANTLGYGGVTSSFGYGLIDAGKSMANLSTLPPNLYISSPSSRTNISGSSQIDVMGTASGPNFAAYKVEIGLGNVPYNWQTVGASSNAVDNTGILASFNPRNLSDGEYSVRLTVTAADGSTYEFRVYGLVIDYFDVSISSPQVAAADGKQDITGTAVAKNGKTISSYTIDYGAGDNPTVYQTAGVVLENSGTQAVSNSRLGQFDASLLTDKQKYQLRVTATATDGTSSTTQIPITIDKKLVPGWPKSNNAWPCVNDASTCEVSPLAVNLDSDPETEIVVGNHPNQLTAYNRDGSVVTGWPFTPPRSSEFFRHAAVAADINGDGKPEIVVISSISNGSGGYIYVLQANGSLLPGWTPKYISSNYFEGQLEDITPSVADLNGDGQPEVVAWEPGLDTSTPLKLHALEPNGLELSGFPTNTPRIASNFTNESSPPVIADLNGDGKPEIITHQLDQVYVFDNAGSLLPGWPQTATASEARVVTAQAVADLYGDGQLEVIARGARNSDSTYQVYAWNMAGTLLPGWPQKSNNSSWFFSDGVSSLAVFDANGDGKDEVAMPADASISLHGINGKRSILFGAGERSGGGSPIPMELTPGGTPAMSRDECSDYFVNQKVYDQSGSLSWVSANHTGGFASPWSCFTSGPLIGDFNGNGQLEMLSTKNFFRPTTASTIFMWELAGTRTYPSDSWLMSGHDAQHTQRWKSSQSPDPIAPQVDLTSPVNGSSVAGNTDINFSANASDNRAVSRVEFSVDGQLICTSTATPYNCNWHSPDNALNTIKTVQAKAFDSANNSASSSVTITVLASADITAPTVTVTAPTGGSSLAGNSDVTLAATASDNKAVTKVEFYVNSLLACTAYTSPYSCQWHTPNSASNLSATIQAKAYDAANNIGTSAIVTTTVLATPDITPPTTTLTSPTNGSNLPGNSNVTLSAMASDNRAVSRVEFYVSGQLVCTTTVSPYSCQWRTPDSATNSSKTISSVAYDAAGNSATSSINVTVLATLDIIAPTTTITSPTSGSSVKRNSTITISANASDNRGVISRVEFYINGQLICSDTSAPYQCSWRVPNSGNSSYSLVTRAYDAAGNIGVSSTVTVRSN